MTEIASRPTGAEVLENVIIKGDLAQLQPLERVTYYREVCRSIGLNEFTRPFEYIKLNGKLTLYALKGATDQLRSLHGVSIEAPKVDYVDDLIIVSVIARDKTGRTDADTGAVTIGGLKGEAKANAIMKAITKAKRRVTLSMCGLGMLDETEVETIPEAKVWSEPVQAESPPEPVQSAARPETAVVEAEHEPVTITEKRADGLRAELIKLGYDTSNEAQVIETAFGLSELERFTDLTDGEAVILWQRLKRKAAEDAKPAWQKWQTDDEAIAYGSQSGTFSGGGHLVMLLWDQTKDRVGKESGGDLSSLYEEWQRVIDERIAEEKKAA